LKRNKFTEFSKIVYKSELLLTWNYKNPAVARFFCGLNSESHLFIIIFYFPINRSLSISF
jgi:hypothetical protein